MIRIILEKCYGPQFDPKTGKWDPNAYLGMIVVDIKDLTPEYLQTLRDDDTDIEGWHKYRRIMKDHGYDLGEAEIID